MWGVGDRSGEIDTLKNLTQSRYLVATPTGAKACAGAGAEGHTGVIDLRLVVEAVEAEIDCLQTAFDAAMAKSKSKLIAPTWPRLPNPIDLGDPPRDRNAPDDVAAALGIARSGPRERRRVRELREGNIAHPVGELFPDIRREVARFQLDPYTVQPVRERRTIAAVLVVAAAQHILNRGLIGADMHCQ